MRSGSFRRLVLASSVLLLAACVSSPAALAFGSLLDDFDARYGTAGSRLSTCGLCHDNFNGRGSLNGYGGAFDSVGGISEVRFLAIEAGDADGDLTANLDEILLLFLPGVSCDSRADASNAPADLADYVDPANVGCGTQAFPDIAVSPGSLSFGAVSVGGVGARTATIRNLGGADLELADLVITGSPDFTFTPPAPTVPAVVPPGGILDVMVDYQPSAAGDDTGTLVITSDDPDSPSLSVALSGSGIATQVACDIDVSTAALDFGSVPIGGTAARSATIGNTGTADCTVASLAVTGAEFALGAGAPVGSFGVAPGALVEVPVVYAPVDAGSDTGSLSVASDDADEPVVSVALSGAGFQDVPNPGGGGDSDSDSDTDSDSDGRSGAGSSSSDSDVSSDSRSGHGSGGPAPSAGGSVNQVLALSATICSDGLDNDGDGRTDYPEDPGCATAGQQSESDMRCGLGFELALALPLLMRLRRRRR